MFKYYVKVAWRNLRKDRLFTFLNLLGLSTGLVCTILIYLWVTDELNVDRYNENDRRLYQVMSNQKHDNGIETMNNTPGILARTLAAEIPEIEYASTVVPASWFSNKGVISSGEKSIRAGVQFIDKSYFQVFTCKFIDGDKNKIFGDKQSMAISSELAMKLFNTTENIIGKTVKWDHNEYTGSYLVTGIFEKNPINATNQFDLLLNYALFEEKRQGLLTWDNSDPSTFIVIKNGVNPEKLNEKLRHFITSKNTQVKSELLLINYADKYLHGQFGNGVQTGGRIAYVKMFSLIAVFILMIACINFMNLSTATASARMKETGIRKVVGAARGALVVQYLAESLLMTVLSMIMAILMLALLLPVFNDITGKNIPLNFNSGMIFSIAGITLVTGLISGSYPAFYLSSFKPVAILKGKLKTTAGEIWIRKGLVVFQFTLSVMFIVSAIAVYRQINYIQTRNLGYNRDHALHFEIPLEMNEAKLKSAQTFLYSLKKIPGVLSASSYYHNLTGQHGGISGVEWPGKNPHQDINFANLEVGLEFIEAIGMKFKEGRGFTSAEAADREIVFNESAIKNMGIKNPIGKTIKFWGKEKQIVGITEDFNFESLYETVKPCFFQAYPILPNVLVRIQGGSEKQTIARIESEFLKFNRGAPFDYTFLDEDYQALYSSEQRVGILARYFAGMAIIISCLGLFGLAAFTAQKRKKEIGIRKVVGASVSGLAVLLSKDFINLAVIAICIAFPVAWWGMSQWLDGFAYRIKLSADIFLLTALATLVITLLTISFQAVKAALANPVRSLRTE